MKENLLSQNFNSMDSESFAFYYKELKKEKYNPMTDITKIKACYARFNASKTAKNPEGDIEFLYPFINSNMRYVASIAKKFLNERLAFGDLFNEGFIGLLEAAKRFNPNLGYKFTTFATDYIENHIKAALYDSNTVRIPEKKNKLIFKIRRFVSSYEAMNGMEPTVEDIADRFDLSEVDAIYMLNYSTAFTSSLDTVVDDFELDNEAYRNIEKEDMAHTLRNALGILSSKECDCIRLLFGIDEEPMVAKEIALEWGVTADYVGQIKRGALAKLRKHQGLKALCYDFVG